MRGIESEAGYYFMPDFEVCRRGLEKEGIVDGAGMVQAMLRQARIAVSPSIYFLLSDPIHFQGDSFSKRKEIHTSLARARFLQGVRQKIFIRAISAHLGVNISVLSMIIDCYLQTE